MKHQQRKHAVEMRLDEGVPAKVRVHGEFGGFRTPGYTRLNLLCGWD
jgi:hypothetical protein